MLVVIACFVVVASFSSRESSAQEAVFLDGFELGNLCTWSFPPEDLDASVAISTNPSVEQFLEISSSCGSLYYQGSRDADGLVTTIKTIYYEVADEVYKTDLDDQGRPIRMFDQRLGTSFELDWLTETQVSITAISRDGKVQVTVLADLANPSSMLNVDVGKLENGTVSRGRRSSNLEPRGGVPVRLISGSHPSTGSPPRSMEVAASSELSLGRKAASPSTVTVERCGEPVENASSTITMISENRVLRVAGASAGPGQYVHSLPTSDFETGDSLEEICSSTSTIVGNACTWIVEPISQSGGALPLCAWLAGALDVVIGGPTGEGVLIFEGCTGGFTAAVILCESALASPGPGGPSALDTILCENASEASNAIAGPGVTLVAQAIVPGGGVISDTKTALATGPYPNFFLQAASQATVTSFTISPPDPAPFEGYVATADIACAPASTEVRMEISGTDGYYDSSICTVSGDDVCSLYVPGASDGIMDTITVSIGGEVLRSTVIVF